MEEILVLIIIIFLTFGLGVEDINFPEVIEKDEVSVEEDKVTGNEEIEEKKEDKDNIRKIFQDSITGNSSINLNTESGNIHSFFKGSIEGNAHINLTSRNGDIYVKFFDKIAGNVKINIKTYRGDIHLLFQDKLLGNSNINVGSSSNIILYNGKNSLQRFNITVDSGRVKYKNKSRFRDSWTD